MTGHFRLFRTSLPTVQGLMNVQSAIQSCSISSSAPTIVHVSKMFAVPVTLLPRQPGDPSPTNPQQEIFLAFGRVFAGQLRTGQELLVLSAAYNPAVPDKHQQTAKVILLTAHKRHFMLGVKEAVAMLCS